MRIFLNSILIIGSDSEKQRFMTDMMHCSIDQSCKCNLCPLMKLLKNKKNRIGKMPNILGYSTEYGMSFDVKTKNTKLHHMVRTIAKSYPDMLFQVSTTSDTLNEYIDETFIYKNNFTLVANSNAADKKVSFIDRDNQVVSKGSRISTANGDVLIVDGISSENSKLILSLRGYTEGAVARIQHGMQQDEVTRLNYWDDIFNFLVEQINSNAGPLFGLEKVNVSDSLAKLMETFSDIHAPICLFLVGHSYGFWGAAEENIVASNNAALKHGGALISKHDCLHDQIVIVTDDTRTETKMFLLSDVPSQHS